MTRIHVKPAEGLAIPSPDHGGKNLPPDGGWVESSTYWSRRLAEGDVNDDTEAATAQEAAAEEAAAKASADAERAAKKAGKTPDKEG